MPALLQRAKGGPAPLQISEEDEEAEEEGDLPPTPLAPDRVELKPYEDVEKEEAPTLEEAWREVDDVCRRCVVLLRLAPSRVSIGTQMGTR